MLFLLLGCSQPPVATYWDYPVLTVSTDSLEFSRIGRGESEPRTFTVANTGDLPMGVEITQGKGMGPHFDLWWEAEGITCAEPEGAEKGVGPPDPVMVLSATDQDGNGRPEMDFGTVVEGGNSVQYLTIANVGSDNLSLIAAQLTNATAGFSLLSVLGGSTVPPGQEAKLFIQFDATSNDPAETQLVLVSSDPSSGAVTIDLFANVEPVPPWLVLLEADCKVPVAVTFSPLESGLLVGSILVETWTQEPAGDEQPAYYADRVRSQHVVTLEGEGEPSRSPTSPLFWPGHPILVGGIDPSQTACEPGEQLQFSVLPHDPAGRELTLSWQVSAGHLDDAGAETVTWTAPTPEEVGLGLVVEIWVELEDGDPGYYSDDYGYLGIEVYPEHALYQQHVEIEREDDRRREARCSAVSSDSVMGLALAALLALIGRR